MKTIQNEPEGMSKKQMKNKLNFKSEIFANPPKKIFFFVIG